MKNIVANIKENSWDTFDEGCQVRFACTFKDFLRFLKHDAKKSTTFIVYASNAITYLWDLERISKPQTIIYDHGWKIQDPEFRGKYFNMDIDMLTGGDNDIIYVIDEQ